MMTDKDKLLRRFNGAIATNDLDYIKMNITDDIIWVIAGDKIVKGKENFIREVQSMNDEKGFELNIDNVITHGSAAAVDGTMVKNEKNGTSLTWAFCDIYSFSEFKTPRIKKITSYVVTVGQSE
ncbi:MAG: nuclear transport factor 2 family protein [Cyclobacteriaceae bacterium]|nr:nuclear transport factor 2 family protein [Cyclobacteriaceae bacterium]